MKILGINASPRNGSNVKAAPEIVIEDAKSKGAEGEIVDVNGLTISPCQADNYCKEHDGECALNDDMQDIYQKLEECNVIILGSPIYSVISMILLTVSTLCMVYTPKVAGKTVDLLASNWNSLNDPAIYINLALLLVLYSIGYLFKLPPKRIMGGIGEKVVYNLRMRLFDKLDAIGSGFIQENSKGLVLSRLNNDVMNIREFVSSRFTEIYAQIILVVFVIVLIVMTDFRLSLVYLVILPIYAICFMCVMLNPEPIMMVIKSSWLV